MSRRSRNTINSDIFDATNTDGQTNVDPQEFRGVIRTPCISEFQPYNKHKVSKFPTLYTTISQEKLKSKLAKH